MLANFPAIIEGNDAEGYCADVLGAGALGQGPTPVAALTNAAEILQQLIWDAVSAGEPVPMPGSSETDDLKRGQLALVQATLPAQAA